MMKLVKEHINEEINASEAYHNEGAIQTVVSGKRNVGLVELDNQKVEQLKSKGLKVIKVFPENSQIRSEYHKEMKNYWPEISLQRIMDQTYILYNARSESEAQQLYDYMKANQGFLSDKTPEEATKIGKLLGYNDASIQSFIDRIYKNKKIRESKNSDSGLNKKLIRIVKDAGGKDLKIYTVNGSFVKASNPGLNFNEFIEGGHHYVGSYPGYKKIPEDEIWIDEIFLQKPIDLKGIILHEYTERNLMKYKGWTYEKAHEYANKREKEYRERVKK